METTTTTRLVFKLIDGHNIECEIEFTEFIKNKRLSWRTIKGDFTAFASTLLVPMGNETELRVLYCMEIGKLQLNIGLKKEIEKYLDEGFERLKTILKN